MFTRLRPRSAYDVMAALSLFIVLGGTSYAVATNSIGSAQIKNNSIRSKDIRNSQVSSGDVRNRSLLAKDFKAGQLPAGPRGAPGATGQTGAAGPAGPLSLQYVEGTSVPLPAASGVTGSAPCPDGKSVTGGGATILTVGPDVIMDSSYPSDNASDADSIRDNAWSVAYNNPTASASSFRVYAICTTPNSKS